MKRQSKFSPVHELILLLILASLFLIRLYVSTGQHLFICFTAAYKSVLPLLG